MASTIQLTQHEAFVQQAHLQSLKHSSATSKAVSAHLRFAKAAERKKARIGRISIH